MISISKVGTCNAKVKRQSEFSHQPLLVNPISVSGHAWFVAGIKSMLKTTLLEIITIADQSRRVLLPVSGGPEPL